MGGHLAFPQNAILYTNKPTMGSHLSWKATFQVPQGWLLIAGSTVYQITLQSVPVEMSYFDLKKYIFTKYQWQGNNKDLSTTH